MEKSPDTGGWQPIPLHIDVPFGEPLPPQKPKDNPELGEKKTKNDSRYNGSTMLRDDDVDPRAWNPLDDRIKSDDDL